MGYYATWGGQIKFKDKPSKDIIEKINDCFVCYDQNENTLSVGDYSKYYEDAAYEVLDKIAPLVESGEIEYSGEDESHWRFIFKDGTWNEEYGYIHYESELTKAEEDKEEFLGRIIDVMQDCFDDQKGKTIEGDWYDKIHSELESIMKAWEVFK